MSYQDLLPQELPNLQQREDLTIFDTRDHASFTQGHIPGARMINDDEIKKLIIKKKRAAPVVIYCAHGNTSRDLCQLICGMDFKEVYNLQGGWLAWQNLTIEEAELETLSNN